MSLMGLALLILASFRLTRLLVEDSILDGPRDWLSKVPFLGQVLSCQWCAGVWVSVGLAVANHFYPTWMYWPVLALAIAGGQGLLAAWASRE